MSSQYQNGYLEVHCKLGERCESEEWMLWIHGLVGSGKIYFIYHIRQHLEGFKLRAFLFFNRDVIVKGKSDPTMVIRTRIS
jgi:hypothetical protein